MATCADCVHVEVCRFKDLSAPLSDSYIRESECIEKCCGDFKGRFRFVELPCRIGDTVYCGSFGKLMEDEIICITIDVNETRVVLKRGISYNIDKINQMFFFTREEAEQALKEREENA